MLTEIYIEALLIDEKLADQVWEAWYSGEADEQTACLAWMLIAILYGRPTQPHIDFCFCKAQGDLRWNTKSTDF